MYGANPQDLARYVVVFHISSTMYSKTSNRVGFMIESNKAGIASEYSILGARVFLIIRWRIKKWGRSPSISGA
jgi:hypothetical protein